MAYKIYKLFLKIASSFQLIFINIVFISILFLYSQSAYSKVTNLERNLAYRYCDSIEKNLFKGLDNERILKYEYFFSPFNDKELNEELKSLSNFTLEVNSICSYKLSNEEIEDIKEELTSYLSNK
tara:strand:- start:14 stop:388 length:375 start_codon:yes stop_codon:yes gene_type:complete